MAEHLHMQSRLTGSGEGIEDALGLFAPEEPIAEADDRADADTRLLDVFRPRALGFSFHLVDRD